MQACGPLDLLYITWIIGYFLYALIVRAGYTDQRRIEMGQRQWSSRSNASTTSRHTWVKSAEVVCGDDGRDT